MSRQNLFVVLAASLVAGCGANEAARPTSGHAEVAADVAAQGPVIDHQVETIEGEQVSLADYRGKALLIVNTASNCGYTPQYAELQQLYATYKDQGLEVLAFPSNDYGNQEPGTNEEIAEFVDSRFDVQFPMFAKIGTAGADKSDLYRALTEETPPPIAGEIQWNFTKFLVDPEGHVVARFESTTKPMSPEVVESVETVLPKS